MCESFVEIVCFVCLVEFCLIFVFSRLSDLATVSVVGQSVVATSLSVVLPYTVPMFSESDNFHKLFNQINKFSSFHLGFREISWVMSSF